MSRIKRLLPSLPSLSTLSVLLLAACGGGLEAPPAQVAAATPERSMSSSVAGTAAPDRQALGLSSVAKPSTRFEAARFLAQATFGPTDAEIDALMTMGYEAWIDRQFALPLNSKRHQLNYEGFERAGFGGEQAVHDSFWTQVLTGEDQLRQRMAFALSQIFVVSLNDSVVDNDDRSVAAWLDLLSTHGLGTYRQLLEQVSLNPVMGIFLSHIANQKADNNGRVPDENYSREVMQLFSLGLVQLNEDGSERKGLDGVALETYTPADVSELAKVFTGWSWACPQPSANSCFSRGSVNNTSDPDRNLKPMIPYERYHSTEAKRFLGLTIPAQSSPDARASLKLALDHLAAHPNVGPFIGRQLIQRFTTSNPSPAYVAAVAKAFNNNGLGVRGDMKAVLKAVLLHPEARRAGASGKVREPVLRLSAFLRSFPHRSLSGRYRIGNTDNPATTLSQTALRAPSVFNFYRPGYVAPGSDSAARGMVAPELQIANETSVAGYVNYMRDTIALGAGDQAGDGQTYRDLRADYFPELALATNPSALVDRVTQRLLYGSLSESRFEEILTAVNSIAIPAPGSSQSRIDRAKRERVNTALLLTVASPEFLVLK